MNEEQRSLLHSSSSRFPPPQGVKLSYGTAGFRADAELLQSTVYRVGILAALRALKTQSVIGLMITASHNKVSDNGIKIADPNGGMLSQDWEPFADALANAANPEHLLQLVAQFVEDQIIKLNGTTSVQILVARDTRPSGPLLLEAAKIVNSYPLIRFQKLFLVFIIQVNFFLLVSELIRYILELNRSA